MYNGSSEPLMYLLAFCGCVMTPLCPTCHRVRLASAVSFQSGARSNSMIGVGSASDLAVVINPHVDMLQHQVAKVKFSALYSSSVFDDLQN